MITQSDNSFSGLRETLKQKLSLLEQKATALSISDSGFEMPRTLEETHLFFKPFHDEGVECLDLINTTAGALNLGYQTGQHNQQSDEKTRELSNELDTAMEGQRKANENVKDLRPPYNKTTTIVAWCVLILVNLFEGLFISVPVFRSLGLSGIESFGLGLLFSAFMTAYAHLIPRIILQGKTKLQRRIIFVIILFLTAILFYFMAQARVNYLQGMMQGYDSEIHIQYNPWMFCLTSLLLFAVATAIGYFFLPSKEQYKEMQEYKKLLMEKEDADLKVEGLKKEISSTKDRKNSVKNNNAAQYIAASDLEEFVINKTEGIYATYKRENVKHRTSPSPFVPEPYPFIWKRNFKTQRSLQ